MTAPETNQPHKTHELAKTYDPRDVEGRWYPWWVEQGLFEGKDDPARSREPFCIVIPPPNVTGSLHCGHALFATIQDVYTRQARMAGKNTLWLPGVDHAGIATQVVVERLLKREGTDRHALGREKFLERVWKWKEQSGGTIDDQLKVLGSSCDWRRHRFTMDPHMSRAVREAFVRLYQEGLIYRAERLVNWSVGGQTVLSDLEVDSNEEDGELFEFAYEVADAMGESIVVATTRPETMLGDTAVAVHPDDPRYQHLIGRQLKHPFVDRRIPVIADSILVDPKFGTGAVKVTPAHDFNDFATGKRHQLPMVNIMNKDGTLNDNAGEFRGMERFAARKAVKRRLEELGFVKGSKKHRLAVPRCQRTNTVVEPLLSEQWYVKADVLAKPAIEAVQSGKTVIVPEEWTKTYMHWMTNIQDWCISRQLWWGHQIPAWYCGDCRHVTVSRDDAKACEVCKSTNIVQDDDVLDTWFSSGLWPFATLGWPDENAPALKTFYPTTIMETGFDILFFWVARMMMMGIHFMGDVPFRKIYLHGMVTDEKGDKMSKVKGNVIDPLDVVYGIELEPLVSKIKDGGATDAALKTARNTYPEGIPAYGADALRWTLSTYPPQQRKIPLSIKRIEGGRFLCNKLWNATRFALPMLGVVGARGVAHESEGNEHDKIAQADLDAPPAPQTLADRWILSRLSATAAAVQQGIDEFRLDDSTSALYRFFWNELCDWYLELVKPVLSPREGAPKVDADAARVTRATLARSLEATLRLMHPFIPFVSEELWQKLPKPSDRPGSIVTAPWPTPGARDEAAERDMAALQGAIGAVRTIRTEHEISPAASVHVRLCTDNAELRALLQREEIAIRTLAKVDPLEIVGSGTRPAGFATSSAGEIEVQVLLKGLVDAAHETARIERELKRIDKDLQGMEKKLSQPAFTEKAPPEVVAEARARLDELKTARARLEAGRGLIDELKG
ncbi:MAG: valine--tRNA ligase [Deltaproteobacteria bacterium]|nr:valine--tRNA ligase [Deltaproteobacteria bacterium]